MEFVFRGSLFALQDAPQIASPAASELNLKAVHRDLVSVMEIHNISRALPYWLDDAVKGNGRGDGVNVLDISQLIERSLK